MSGGTQNAYDSERYTMLSEELNATITPEEVLQVTKTLKNNKSTITVMCPLYVKLFNVIFERGIVPESWTLGIKYKTDF